MGSIYKPKYRRRDGTVAESAVYWCKYFVNGQPRRESTGKKTERAAIGVLRVKEGDAEKGLAVVHKVNRKTVADLLADVVADYKNHERDTLKNTESRIRNHLLPFFGTWNAASITDDQVRRYVTERKAEGAKNSTINRELSVLRRGYELNRREVTVRPNIEKQNENNARQGFFEPGDFERVRDALPEVALTKLNVKSNRQAQFRPLLTVAYITGRRTTDELLPMEWRQVDFAARTIRLEPGTKKNDRGREFPFTDELEEALLAQRAYTDAVQRKLGAIVPYVFHRSDGKRIKFWRRQWLKALLKVGLAYREAGEDGKPKKGGKIIPHVIVHDFRRTAIRNLSRAGASEAVAMKLCGHETRSVFDRYRIVTGDDLREAAAKLNAAEKATGKVTGKVAVTKSSRGR